MDNNQRREDLLNSAKNAADKQSKGLIVNFDEAYDAYKAEGNEIEVTFEGKRYTFASEPSAQVMTYILKSGGRMKNEDGIHLLKTIIGDEFMDAISKSKAPFSLIVETVLNPIMEVYGFGGAKHVPDEQGKVATPV